MIRKTGRFDNIDSAVIISSVSKAVQNTADDDSRIFVVEISSFRNHCDFIFLLKVHNFISAKLCKTHGKNEVYLCSFYQFMVLGS